MRPYTCALVVFAAVVVALGAMGCESEDGGLSAGEYYRLIEAIDSGYAACAEGVAPGATFGLISANPEVVRGVILALLPLLVRQNDALTALVPAEEAQDAHAEYLDARVAQAKLGQDFADHLVGVDSYSALQEAWEQFRPRFDAASERAGTACRELEALAAVSGIGIDLDCERY